MISSCDIAKGVDEIVFDPGTKEVYCGCAGYISIVKVSKKKGLTNVGDVPITAKSHNVAIDPESRSLWIGFNDDKGSYLQEYRQPTAVADR